jgi:two-component system, chemotaxis family, chemotaxis protein CheY
LSPSVDLYDTTRPPGQQLVKGRGGLLSHSILIVDDSETIRRLVRSCIERRTDWKVCGEAENGVTALEKFKELRPDMVILDFQMPEMNGLEAAREIARLAPNTPMVMFTMYDGGQLRELAQSAGIREIISKSDRFAERLIPALKNALESPHPNQQQSAI